MAWTHMASDPCAPLPNFPIAIPAFHMLPLQLARDAELADRELAEELRREATAADDGDDDDDERAPPMVMHCPPLDEPAVAREDVSSTVFSPKVGKLTVSSLGRVPRPSPSAESLLHQ